MSAVRDVDWWMPRILIAALLACLGFLIWLTNRPASPPKPCSYFADWPIKDVPARCTNNFNSSGGVNPG